GDQSMIADGVTRMKRESSLAFHKAVVDNMQMIGNKIYIYFPKTPSGCNWRAGSVNYNNSTGGGWASYGYDYNPGGGDLAEYEFKSVSSIPMDYVETIYISGALKCDWAVGMADNFQILHYVNDGRTRTVVSYFNGNEQESIINWQ
ncbi:hypothetical protein, partial [Anoxynatronum sibiricum]